MRAMSVFLTLALALSMVAGLSAAEKKPPRDGRGGRPGPGAGMGPGAGFGMIQHFDRVLKRVELSKEQRAQWEKLKEEYAPKFKEAIEARENILTPEQREAGRKAESAAIEAGKRDPEVREAVREAVKLSEEQKAKMAESHKALQTLREKVREELFSILTSEQQEQFKKLMRQRPDGSRGSGGHGGRHRHRHGPDDRGGPNHPRGPRGPEGPGGPDEPFGPPDE